MNTKLICLTSLVVGLTLNAIAEVKKMVPSQLKEATVFFEGAELTHVATVLLQQGDNQVQITGLSPEVDRNSLKIKTTNGVLVSSFEFSVDYLSDKPAKNDSLSAQKIQAEIEGYKRKIAETETNIKVGTDMLSVLQKSVIKNVEGSEKGLPIDELIKTMDYYKSKSLELEAQIRQDKDKVTALKKEMATLQAQLNQDPARNNKAMGVVKLQLASPMVGNSELTISYYTSQAGWTPYYDINVASTNKPISITTKAKVRQVTGIDWTKVKLTLSTSMPSSGKVAPLFQAWFLNYYQAPRPMRARNVNNKDLIVQNSYAYEIAASPIATDEDAPAQPLMDTYVMRSENQLNVTYNIDIPYTIPGNGKEQNVELKNQEVAATFKYYSAPKLDPETYVLAEIGEWQKLGLLSATANVTYDGTYVGETLIDASSTSETLTLTLGGDKRIPVKREKLQDYSSTKFMGSDTRQSFVYQLTVRNNQNVPIKMVLKDQYPISTLKEIEVELLLKETTKPSFNIEEIGVITWEIDLQPGETRVFKLAYSVKYPKGSNINL